MSSRISTNELTEGSEATLYCEYTNITSGNIKAIKWFKDNDSEIFNSTNENIAIFENELKFSYLNDLIHNGDYKCQIELTNGQNLMSNQIEMRVSSNILFNTSLYSNHVFMNIIFFMFSEYAIQSSHCGNSYFNCSCFLSCYYPGVIFCYSQVSNN